MSAPTVVAVADGSAASQAGISPGDEILSINGVVPRDVIEYQMLIDEPEVSVELTRDSAKLVLDISKNAGDPLGVEIQSAVFDRVRTCDNHCEFCFIYQLPKGMRKSLYMKDDDYRLSFLYGNFTTLTRFTEADLERVVGERLSPLYVSIHATNPAVRARMLKNDRGATSLRWLRALLDSGIQIHGQIVLCPGVNDGEILEDTLSGVLDEYPDLASVGIVPLGVSSYTTEPAMRPHTAEELNAVIKKVNEYQQIFLDTLGKRMVYISDEYYVLAGLPIPVADEYEDFAQHENGIGIVRQFLDSFENPKLSARAAYSGFFQWVEGAPAEGYRSPRMRDFRSHSNVRLKRRPERILLLTGELGAPVLNRIVPKLNAISTAPVSVRAVKNEFFGGNIGVAGLLTGGDIKKNLSDVGATTAVLIPDICLSNGKFLDDMSFEEMPANVQVVRTDGAALRTAVEHCYV